jgi:ubiquinone/menaquinone biosynthesis C-methylase UbiE
MTTNYEKQENVGWKDYINNTLKNKPIFMIYAYQYGNAKYLCDKIIPTINLNNKKVLEIGGGIAWLSILLKHYFPTSDITTTDISETAINASKKLSKYLNARINRFVKCDMNNTPFKNSHFDFIIGCSCLHHSNDILKTCLEMKRVLKDNGKVLFFNEPKAGKILKKLFLLKYSPAGKRIKKYRINEDIYTLKEYTKAFKQAGFKTLKITAEKDFYYKQESSVAPLYYRFISIFPEDVILKFLPTAVTIKASKKR